MPQHGGDLASHQLDQHLAAFVLAEREQAAHQRIGGLGTDSRPARAGSDEAAQQRPDLALRPQRGQVQVDREHQRFPGQRGVEQCDALLGRHRAHPGAGHPFRVGSGHHAGVRPRAPRQRDAGQTGGPALGGERVEEGVGGGVVALPGGAEGPGDRGEQHERVQVAGQLVQVPGAVDLGPQHLVQALGRQRVEHAVVEHACRVDDGLHVVLRQQLGQRLAVGHIAGRDLHVRVDVRNICLAAAADQQQVAHPVLGDQVPRDRQAQTTGAPGDQHLTGPADRLLRGDAREARHQDLTVLDPHVRLVHGERFGGHVGVGLDQAEPARVFGLRRAHQAADRGRGEPAAGHDHQPRVTFFGQPALEHAEHFGRRRVGIVGFEAVHLVLIHSGLNGSRNPVDAEQCVTAHAGRPLDRPGGQRADRGDQLPGRVCDGHLTGSGKPHPQRGRAGRVQGDALPRERHASLATAVGERRSVQAGVQQRRVQAEVVHIDVVGQGDLGEQVVTAAPGGTQALEHRPVVDAEFGEALVTTVHIEQFGSGGRPDRGVEGGAFGAGGQHTGRVLHPRGAVLAAAADGHRLAADPHLELDRALLGQHQRGGEGQLFEPIAADLVGGPQRQLDERGAGQQHLAADPVVGEPGVGPPRQPAGEQHLILAKFDRGAEQRVLGGGQAEAGRVPGAEGARRPEPLVLEGVGGQLDPVGTGVERLPVDRHAVDVQPGERGEGRSLLRLVLAQERHRERGLGDHRGQHTGRAQLEEVRVTDGGHVAGEAHGFPHVPHPVLPVRDVARHRNAGFVEGQTLDGGPEIVQHRVHQRRVERVRDLEPAGLLEASRDLQHRGLVTRDDHRVRAVHRRDRHALGESDLVFRGLDGDHRPTGRERLHQSGASLDERAGVFEGEHARHMGGGDLTDRMPSQRVRLDAPRLDQPEQRHFQREERRLRIPRLVQRLLILTPHDVTDVEVLEDLIQGGGENRESVVQFAAHAEPLRALAREQDGQRARLRPAPRDLGAVEQHGPVVEGRARVQQRVPDVGRGVGQRPDAFDLIVQGGFGLRRHDQRYRVFDRRRLGGLRRRSLLQDHVRVRAADAERGHTRPAHPVDLRPLRALGHQLDRAGLPVHMGRRRVDVQGLGQHAVPHGHDHLDHARHPGRRLRVAEVRLDRTQQQRRFAITAIGGQQRLRFDRVTQRGARAVRLDRVHVLSGQTGAGERLADHPLLRRPVRRGQAVRRTILVHRTAAHHGQDLVPVPLRVGHALQHEQADTLGETGTISSVGERLAPAVRGKPALTREGDVGARGGHDRHATSKRQRALASPQSLRGQVQRDQRRRARRVDRDGRALEAEGVGQAPGRHAQLRAGALVALVVLDQRAVVVVHHAGEHAGLAALERGRVDARALDRLPRGLQEQALLRVRRQGFTRAHAEELGVEVGGVVQEAAGSRVGGAGMVGVRVVEPVQVPAAVLGEPRDRVGPVEHQVPEFLRRTDATGEPAAHPDDHDRVVGDLEDLGAVKVAFAATEQLVTQVSGQHGGRRVVEDHGGGQPQAGRRGQPVAQLHGGQRVEAQVLEGLRRVDRRRARVPEHHGDQPADHLLQGLDALGVAQPGEPLHQRVGSHFASGGTPCARAREPPQQRRHLAAAPQHRQVHVHRQDHRLTGGQRGIEQRDALLGRQGRHAVLGQAPQVGVGHVAGQADRAVPRAPHQRHAGQSGGPALADQRVHGGVRGGVVALAGAAEHSGTGRVDDEGGQVAGEFVQVARGVELRAEDGVQAIRRQRADHAVVEHTRRVHHGLDLVLGQQFGELVPVGHVTGGDLHVGIDVGHVGLAAAADQQQVAHTVLVHQVPGEHPTQAAGAAGDQHEFVGVPGEPLRRGGHAREARHQDFATTDRELRLSAGHGRRDQREVLGFDQHEPAGVLRLRRAHQAPDRRRGLGLPTGNQYEPRVGEPLVGQPALEQVERVRGQLTHRVELGQRQDHRFRNILNGLQRLVHRQYRLRTGGGRGHPVNAEQAVARRVAELIGGHLAQHQRVDRRDRGTRGIRDLDRQAVALGTQAHPHGGRTDRVQRNTFPGERQRTTAQHTQLGEARRVQRGVQQGRMQAEAVRRNTLRQGHLGEHLVAVLPGRTQATEDRAVGEPVVGEAFVAALHREGFGTGRRPVHTVESGRTAAGAQEPGGVLGPRQVGRVLGPAVHGERAPPVLVGQAHAQLQLDGPLLRQHQRRREREFVDPVAAQFVPGPHGEFDEGRAGQQHLAEHGVVGQPRVRPQ
ncbi:hypothetical protein GCM10027199_35950 [Amycolatopsis magusensis]